MAESRRRRSPRSSSFVASVHAYALDPVHPLVHPPTDNAVAEHRSVRPAFRSFQSRRGRAETRPPTSFTATDSPRIREELIATTPTSRSSIASSRVPGRDDRRPNLLEESYFARRSSGRASFFLFSLHRRRLPADRHAGLPCISWPRRKGDMQCHT